MPEVDTAKGYASFAALLEGFLAADGTKGRRAFMRRHAPAAWYEGAADPFPDVINLERDEVQFLRAALKVDPAARATAAELVSMPFCWERA